MKITKKSFYERIDLKANKIAQKFTGGGKITSDILEEIIDLYDSAKVEQDFADPFFETAYHTPISGDLEFFIARILYHYSKLNDQEWKILLRKQEKNTAPDVRLLKENKTFAIIEVKAKAGWIQPFFSSERFQKDKDKLLRGESEFNPEILIDKTKTQLNKYYETFNISNKDVFLFLPTLALVHKVKYTTELSGYHEYFSSTSGLPKENLILLSSNKRLDLSKDKLDKKTEDLQPTDHFERLITRLTIIKNLN
jgi:hypothetical protein